MKKQFKELTLEFYTDNLNRHHVRLDNILDNQYVNILSTTNKVQAALLFQDIYDVLKKNQEN